MLLTLDSPSGEGEQVYEEMNNEEMKLGTKAADSVGKPVL